MATYWKFTSTTGLKCLIETQKVRVSPAIDLNDPGEFKFKIHHYTRAEFGVEIAKPHVFNKYWKNLDEFLGRPLASPSDIKPDELDKLFASFEFSLGLLKANTSRMKSDLSRLYGVYSCCGDYTRTPDKIHPMDNPAMWAHYANNHEGVAYSLNDSFFEGGFTFMPVAYGIAAPLIKVSLEMIEGRFPKPPYEINISRHMSQIVSSKHKTWEYESEHRVLVPLESTEYLTGQNIYLSKINSNSLGTIIFGCRTPEKEIREITQLAKKHLSHKPIDFVKAWEDLDTYALQRIPFPSASKP